MQVKQQLRWILFLGALCVSVVPSSAQQPKLPTLRWLGQSFFVLETSKGTRIAFDPHAIEAFGRQTVKADVVLITHPHPDHTRLEVIENRPTAKIIEGVKTSPGGPEGGARAQWNPVDERFKDVRIRSVGTFHDTMQGLQRGKNTVFVLEFDGLRLAHLGDLGHLLSEEQLRSIGPLDVLLIPVGGVYTINGDAAKKVVAQIKPSKYILPMHYGTRTFDDLMPPDEFLDGQKNVKKMPNTNELVLDPAFKPESPQIVILGWKKRLTAIALLQYDKYWRCEDRMAGINPYIEAAKVKRPTSKYKVTFMPMNVTFEVDPRKERYGHNGLELSVLDISEAAGVPIDHACGGVCACSTCHVIVRDGLDSCNEATDDELDQLDNAPGVELQSRLACQCVPDGSCDIVVEIPEWNRNLAREHD